MIFDWTDNNNKKYIPLITFSMGCVIGGLLWKWYLERPAKMASGGAISNGSMPQQTIIQVAPAPAATAAVAPSPAAPAAIPAATVSSMSSGGM